MKSYLRSYAIAALVAAGFGLRAEVTETPAQPKAEKPPKPTVEEKFAKLDADGSGGLSASEFSPGLDAKEEKDPAKAEKLAAKRESARLAFIEKDKDGDGMISLEEYKAKKPKEEKAPKDKPVPAPEAAP